VSVIGGRKAQMIIGDFCGIASGAKIICGGDDFDNTIGTPLIPERFNNVDYRQVELEGFNLVGTNSIILPGVKMATGSVLYANSVLKSNTEEWTIYSGNPAIAIKIRNKEKILKDAYEIQQLAIRKNT
jgi:galactoside O-acetyltransferase